MVLSSGDYEAFIRFVKETLLTVSIRILAYCVMPNHGRFVLWPEVDRELSHCMHQLTTTHVRRWHNAHRSGGTGHVCQGPFKSFPVENDDHLFTVCRCCGSSATTAGGDWISGRLAGRSSIHRCNLAEVRHRKFHENISATHFW